ncbi:DUF885 family protein [Schlesneria sp. T3-172]|uniref:DUF885 family protein n=1 Tax=Schlesneria sphaerica TaxID=3373610 RepID=UPI0037CC01C1
MRFPFPPQPSVRSRGPWFSLAIGTILLTITVQVFADESPSQKAEFPRPQLQMINGSPQTIDIFWQKSSTEKVPSGTVEPGKDLILSTTLGHQFEVIGRDDKASARVTSEVTYQGFRFDPQGQNGIPAFYEQSVSVDGFPIVASSRVNPYALKEAAYLVKMMLARRPDVREAMIKSGARMCIMARDEFTTDLPEFARLAGEKVPDFDGIAPKDYWDARARGLGGSETDPYCSVAEENLLGFPGDPYEAENILIHEFAHNIHLRGMVNVDPTFDRRLKETYDAAMNAGFWKGKYASVNHHEYFAEGVQSWFDNNRINDHDHNHVNTRELLLEYDPGLAAVCREVFGETELKYTKPATRLTGHLQGYEPQQAPKFEWPKRLLNAQAAIRAQALARNVAAAETTDKTVRNLSGWVVHVHPQLLVSLPAETTKALELLQRQLLEIERVVPPGPLAELKKVPLWFSPEYPNTPPLAEYHPAADWLRDHGRDPAMAQGIEFTNIGIFEAETRRMPNFALHELAHAYHHRVLKDGFENSVIREAFERARSSGDYDNVERQDAEGRKSRGRAYAMTNPQEFFAETTEAYFSRNDFFPYNAIELKQLDPRTYDVLTSVWNVERKDADTMPTDADQTLARIFQEYLEADFTFSPLRGSRLGDRRFDSLLDDVSSETRQKRFGLTQATLDRLAREISYSSLSREGQVDFEILRDSLKLDLWLEEVERPYETDPRIYTGLATDCVYSLLTQSTQSKESAITHALNRMQAIPRILVAARSNLKNPPRIVTETAILQNKGAIAFFQQDLLEIIGNSPQREAVQSAAATVVEELKRHQKFLEDELLPRANGEWRLGREKFAKKLEMVLDAGVTADDVLAEAEANLKLVRSDLLLIAKLLWGRYFPRHPFPPDDEAGRQSAIQQVLQEIGRDHSSAEELANDARATVLTIKQFIKDRNLLRLPDPDRCEIIEMPEFQRGNSVAFLEPAPPLDPNTASIYAISPPPADWDRSRVISFLGEYNRQMLKILTIHEAYPGHYVQLEYANRNPSLIRKVLGSGVYAEGWANYCEQMMLDQGYGEGDPALRMMQLKFRLRSVANAILDHKMHCTEMSDDEALRFLTEDAFQAEGEARLKVVRAKQSSCQLSTYFVGCSAFLRLRQQIQRSMGTEFDLGRYHEAVINEASVPVKFLPELVGRSLKLTEDNASRKP